MKTSCQYKTTAIFFASTQLVHMASPASSCSTNFHVNVHRNDEEQTSSMCKAAQAEKDASPHHITSLANVIGCQDLLHLILLLTADSLQPQDVAINLLGVCKEWAALTKQLPVWQTMEWAHLASKSHRLPDTPTVLFSLLRRWWGAQLRSFSAQGCPVTCELLTDAFCQILATHAPHLQALRLSSCYRITDVGLQHLAAAAPPLCHLELLWSGQAITAAGVMSIAARCPGMQVLVLSCGHDGNGLASMDDACVGALVHCCPQLHTLGLNDCAVGDAGLITIQQTLGHQLSVLQLNHTHCWTVHGVRVLMSNCPHLSQLHIAASSSVCDAVVEEILMHGANLQHLDIARCQRVTCDGVWAAIQRSATIPNRPPLTISLQGSGGPADRVAMDRLLTRVAALNMQQLCAGDSRVVTVLL